MWFLLLACAISEPGPAPEGSPSSNALVDVASVGEQAAEIEELANELTAMIDESRRQVANGQSSQAAEVEKMRSLMHQIETKNDALQITVRKIEQQAHTEAGDVTWPPEPVPKR